MWLPCREALLQGVYEEPYVGQTRIVYGAGCQIKHVLLGRETIRLCIGSLPAKFNDEQLRQLISRWCPGAEVRTYMQHARLAAAWQNAFDLFAGLSMLDS